jgi:alpha-beta hydrolase superfamily lysophospholipase
MTTYSAPAPVEHDHRPETATRTRRRRWPWVLLGFALVLVLAFYVGLGVIFAGVIHHDTFEVRPGNPATTQTGTLTALDVPADGAGGTVTVTLNADDADPDKYANATVGIAVGDSLIVAGPVTSADGAVTTRPVLDLVGAVPEPGAAAGINRDVWTSPDQLGLVSFDIAIGSEGAEYPAWVIPSTSETWAVLIHGKGGYPPEMLRMTTTLHERGINALLISYVNDPGVPASSDGRYGYGTIEVPQVEAALEYAQDQGAERIILGGASHGAAVALGTLQTSDLAGSIEAVILDSPPADLVTNIDAIGDTRSLPVVGLPIPESVETVAMWVAELRYGIDFDDYDWLSEADQMAAPTLIFQGGLDTTVDQSVARELAAAMGSTATLVEQPEAQHVGSWNVDPAAYDAAITAFLDDAGL